MNQWYVYIVECSDGSLYTGITTDVQRRLLEHNYSFKSAKYTRSRRPVQLMWYKEVEGGRSGASREEYRIKKLSRKKKLELINS